MSFTVCFGALIADDIAPRAKGQVFLQTIVGSAPEWSPEKYNDFEPLNRTFHADRLDEALDSWRSCFLWRRKGPRVSGSAWFGNGVHAVAWVRLARSHFAEDVATRYLRGLVRAFRVDLAYVHVAHASDDSDQGAYRVRREPFVAGLTTYKLRAGLPDVAWAMYFGRPYVELFGREHLLSAPAARVEEIGDGVYVQLTSHPSDVADQHAEYSAAQVAVRTHLGRDAFVGDSGEAAGRVPEFTFRVH